MSPGKRMFATFVGAHQRDHHGNTLIFSCPVENTILILVYPPPPRFLFSIRVLFYYRLAERPPATFTFGDINL